MSILLSDLPALSSSSTSSSASTPSSSASSVNSMPQRRIRFAPLPDPRALPIGDDDDSPDTDRDNDDIIDTFPDAIKPCSLSSSSSPVITPKDRPVKQPTTHQLLSHPPIAHAPAWSKPRTLNLLRPFPFNKKSSANSLSSSASSHTLTPTQSLDSTGSTTPTNTSTASRFNFSTEEILTLGTINLFRTSSKNHSSDNGLTRWSSAGSCASNDTPLARTQSAQSSYAPSISSKLRLGSKSRSRSVASASIDTAPKSAPPSKKSVSAPHPTGRKGTRMLNGRVYGGAKRNRDPNANPFANARDEEPEFVEWGYGGMGSVRGGRHGDTKWERLQSDVAFVAGGDGPPKKGVGGEEADVDVDDGSGMGWVRKRREQRERERKEKEEKERAVATANATPTLATPAQDQQPSVTPAMSQSPQASMPHPSPLSSPPTQPRPQPQPLASAPASTINSFLSSPPESATTAPEHNLTAVTLPAHLTRRHSHRRPMSRSASGTASVHSGIGSGASTPSRGLTSPKSAPLPMTTVTTPVLGTGGAPSSLSSSSESESESETDSDEVDGVKRRKRESEDDEEEEEEDEEDEETAQRRITALGAGVEKISRHN